MLYSHSTSSSRSRTQPCVTADPIEFAYGPLELHDSKMGCDLRPIDPAHPRASEAHAALAACAASHGPTEGNGVTSSYYERSDLGVGRGGLAGLQLVQEDLGFLDAFGEL